VVPAAMEYRGPGLLMRECCFEHRTQPLFAVFFE
jgi:hypothetical protein